MPNFAYLVAKILSK